MSPTGRRAHRRSARAAYRHAASVRHPAAAPRGEILFAPAARRHLDLDLHARVGEACLDHGRGRSDMAKVLLEHRPACRKVLAPRQDVAHAHDIVERAAGLRQCAGDVAHGLPALGDDVVGDSHGRVVEAGGAGDEDPVAIDHGAGVTHLRLEARAGGYERSHRCHAISPNSGRSRR